MVLAGYVAGNSKIRTHLWSEAFLLRKLMCANPIPWCPELKDPDIVCTLFALTSPDIF